jgi:AcrR family transcriptional regulator
MKKKPKKIAQKSRKTPAQSRSQETVAVIVEAAARVLEEIGFEGFNTNAVAERAGVSIGSLYQYFRNKDALIASLIERQAEPFVQVLESLPEESFQAALRRVIDVSVRQQLQRPELARLLDFAEKQAAFQVLAERTVERIQAVLTELIARSGAPLVEDPSREALEFLSLARALTDVAGERGEQDGEGLKQRIYRAACGYFGITHKWRDV